MSDERHVERHVELLIGQKVFDGSGRVIGRLQELVAEPRDGIWEITEFHVGTAAMLERLAVGSLRVFGRSGPAKGYRVAWNQIDLSDPQRLRLTCALEDVATL